MKIDLHIHSHASDGHVAPAQVVAAAVAGGLDMIALTDHDTAAGVAEARQAARATELQVIPGIEVSTRFEDADLHILGYWIDPESAAIREHQTASAVRRQDRMRRMVERMQQLGAAVSYDEVVATAGPETRSLGRPHLARALLAGGHIASYGEAFDRYLRDGGPAFVAQDFPTVREGIEMIHAAGGFAVWAHPPIEVFDRVVREFTDWGLDGIECYRPNTPPAQSLLFETAARDLDLFPTGGSDWHGPFRMALGTFYVQEKDVGGLLRAAAERAGIPKPECGPTAA